MACKGDITKCPLNVHEHSHCQFFLFYHPFQGWSIYACWAPWSGLSTNFSSVFRTKDVRLTVWSLLGLSLSKCLCLNLASTLCTHTILHALLNYYYKGLFYHASRAYGNEQNLVYGRERQGQAVVRFHVKVVRVSSSCIIRFVHNPVLEDTGWGINLFNNKMWVFINKEA